ncbi:glycerophosphodiester phosphodiesterase family protein [Magnetospirillum sulfuroxidans]|uniref:Glycerophosphoryl diester phosphodiesterase n=1 Tax=Magnetospirillum sulfuroxidans TaxID=611300 RepID=A0ABS5ID01_9PROT|nr:glycerophosphodiester phosphodiesterase family protein [Magnetospirillum sulfuroxidans]MBR9972302.1 glycerophosphoryl diester phosphodiesterase [Magnetospirillum sulfuroxidans]
MMSPLPPVIGHRGAAGLAPENTLASFALAADLGCAMVEFDVRLSADRVPVVFHDDILDRCTDGFGPVAALTLAQLKRLDAGGGQSIPTLAEVLTLCLERHLAVNIEIKPDGGRERETTDIALSAAGALWPSDRPLPLVSSFSGKALEWARQVAPHWPRGLLAERLPPAWRRLADVYGCATINLRHSWLTAARVAEIKASGLEVLAYTVNRKGRAEKLWFRGVSAVFSDRPDFLLGANIRMS